MSDETTTRPNVMAGDVITQPGLYQSRGGDIVQITGWRAGWWVCEWNGIRTEYDSDGRQRFDEGPEPNPWQLLHWVAPLPASEVEPEPQPQVESQPETDDEMRIRLLEEASIRRVETIGHMQWELQQVQGELARAIQSRDLFAEANRRQADMIAELQRQPEPQPEPPMLQDADERSRLLKECNARQATLIENLKYERAGALHSREMLMRDNRKLTDAADELRNEVSYLQNLLGEAKAELAGAIQGRDLFAAANREQADKIGALQGEAHVLNMEIGGLQRQWAVVKEELTTAAAVCQQLQIELDAAQQVPADSPELRQLQLRLADMTLDRDTYRHAHEFLVQDANTAHERTRAMTVEAIVAWLEPFQGCNSPSLALLLIKALPDIIRNIVGLDSREEID